MKETTRQTVRALSYVSGAIGFVCALGAAGTSDARDELRFMDEEERTKVEATLASEKAVRNLTKVGLFTLAAGVVGLTITDKTQKQR